MLQVFSACELQPQNSTDFTTSNLCIIVLHKSTQTIIPQAIHANVKFSLTVLKQYRQGTETVPSWFLNFFATRPFPNFISITPAAAYGCSEFVKFESSLKFG
jgi:hypothetical protein